LGKWSNRRDTEYWGVEMMGVLGGLQEGAKENWSNKRVTECRFGGGAEGQEGALGNRVQL